MTSPDFPPPAADCTDLLELIPDYAFGLATDDEQRTVEAGLPGCPEAADQLAEFQAIQAALRAGIPQRDPSADLEARLLVAIGAAPAPRSVPTQARPLPSRPALPGRITGARTAWAALAAALIVLVATNLYWAARVSSLSAAPNQPAAFAIADTAAVRWARMPPAQPGGSGAGFMMWNATSQTGIVCVWGLPAPGPGAVYHLWLTRGDQIIAAGNVQTDGRGNGALIFELKAPIDSFSAAYLTAQPPNDSAAPSGPQILAGKLPL